MEDIHQILQQYWGYPSFRPLQEDIIRSVLAGNDTLALLPTGGGKSVCFQVPALAKPGLCLVVSPLVALMKDQVEQLNRRGISAHTIHSGMRFKQIDILLNNCIYGKVKFLYVSPERLKTEILRERVKEMNVSLLAIDEAHCISQWGYDFRPPYLEIAEFRTLIPDVPCIALTATATRQVKEDIQEKLNFPSPNVFRKSFARPNLSYSVLKEENKEQRLLKILERVPGSSVVYVRTRGRTRKISQFLQQRGISASYYHAGLPAQERSQRQDLWISGKIRVMVATNAFGMGIDKPDVRTVVHIDLPQTLEAYYQEAGRAGRDEKKAYATVLYHDDDLLQLEAQVNESYPTIEFIQNVYQRIANYFNLAVGSGELATFDFDLEHFCKTYQLPARSTFNAIKRLEEQGILQLSEGFLRPATLSIMVDAPTLYEYQVANRQADKLLKAVLRIYGGELFDNVLPIAEKKIAQFLQTKPSEVMRDLKWLDGQNIVNYAPSNSAPQITLLQPRFASKQLPIEKNTYQHRKKLALEKAHRLIFYTRETRKCRTLILLDYFDEYSNERCGVCDSCLQQKKRERTQQVLQNFSKTLKAHFGDNAFLFSQLESLYPTIEAKILAEQLRVLQENGEVQFLSNQYWKLT